MSHPAMRLRIPTGRQTASDSRLKQELTRSQKRILRSKDLSQNHGGSTDTNHGGTSTKDDDNTGKKPTPSTVKKGSSSGGSSVKSSAGTRTRGSVGTGDDTDVATPAITAILALGAILAILRRKKHQNME